MSYLKLLGLVAVALGATGLATAASAAAAGGTTLCKSNETPCASTNHYGVGIKFKATSGAMTLVKTFEKTSETINCQSSEIAGKVTSTGSATSNVEAQVETLYFKECVLTTFGGTQHICMNSWMALPLKAVFANTPGTMNGTFTISNGGVGEPKMAVKCPVIGGIECIFTASSLTFDLTGGEKPTLVAKEDSLKGSGGFCPQSLDWNATYTFVEPTPLFLAQSL